MVVAVVELGQQVVLLQLLIKVEMVEMAQQILLQVHQ
tara:strand:+ start:209 stop:319 length:111 start_codon:yes stop_codon:yes gene_type:complete